MNEFIIELQAKLDEAKSKGNINGDISKIQGQLDKLKIQAEIDPKTISNIVKQLEGILNKKISISNINFDTKTGQQIGNTIAKNITDGINKSGSKINNEIKKITEQINKIQLLSNGGIKNDYTTQLAKLEGQYRSLGLTEDQITGKITKVSSALEALKTRVNQPFDESNYQEIISLNDKLQKELAESSNEYTKLQSSAKGYVSVHQRLTKANTIEAWNQKNSNATKEAIANNESYIASLRDLNSQMTKMEFQEISREFKETENSMRGMNRLGASLTNQFKEAAQGITQMLSISSGIMLVVSQTKDAISEIKDLDDILTEISKTSDLTTKELKQLGTESYSTASKYGRNASDYLAGVQSMSQSGFYGEAGKGMAEQSLLAQSAGDMAQDIADKYVIATNAAYKFNGEASKINEVLDGQNSINKIVALYGNM